MPTVGRFGLRFRQAPAPVEMSYRPAVSGAPPLSGNSQLAESGGKGRLPLRPRGERERHRRSCAAETGRRSSRRGVGRAPPRSCRAGSSCWARPSPRGLFNKTIGLFQALPHGPANPETPVFPHRGFVCSSENDEHAAPGPKMVNSGVRSQT